MKEQIANSIAEQTKVQGPLEKYLILLDHYEISLAIQEIVLDSIALDLEHDPETTIIQIESWWQEAFNNSGSKEKESLAGEKSNGNGGNGNETKKARRAAALKAMTDAERVIYERRQGWKDRFYQRDIAGSERKASRRSGRQK